MTNEEKVNQRMVRDRAICAYYLDGRRKLKDCEKRFQLGRQRILQILQAAGVWKPYEKGARTKFLGVNVSEETKDALKEKADAAGVSVSRFASDALDDAVTR